LDDEFNGPAGSLPSSTLWDAKKGQTQGSTVFDGTSQVSEDGKGDLVITAYRDSTGLWHSGWLSSKIPVTGPRDVVARGEVPCGSGTWASPVWEWGYPYGAAPELEDDVIEQLGKEPTTYHATLHYAAVAGGGKTDQSGGPINTGVTLCGGFHTYEAKIYPDRAEFYFDGTLEKTIPVTALTGITDLTVMKEAENIQLTMGGWGGTPTISGPVSMLVDYVRISPLP
jgi:hypothetical protein